VGIHNCQDPVHLGPHGALRRRRFEQHCDVRFEMLWNGGTDVSPAGPCNSVFDKTPFAYTIPKDHDTAR